MKTSAFLSFILVLTIAWMQFYASVRESFNGVPEYKAEIESLKKKVEDERLAREMDSEHFLEFRQNVATLMPGVLKEKGEGEEGYPYRTLASVLTRKESEGVRHVIAKTLFESGRTHFRNQEYAKANRAFQQIIDKFGYTSYVTEAYFLMAEGYFKSNELEECTATVKQMVELFPQAELTGFALIRLGRIYEMQNRNDEAVDIYKTVLRSYPQRDVASQARASLRGVEL
ncbi:MAG: tetratricopeptide repeat protein [Bdellovibrionales bacterium]|nr:tetratricopeptide repeat protein [Bdellovibrionales bacterium]